MVNYTGTFKWIHGRQRTRQQAGGGIVCGALGVVVEVDGPSHFLRVGTDGRTLLKHRLFEAMGWAGGTRSCSWYMFLWFSLLKLLT
jgi:hypothetical protein